MYNDAARQGGGGCIEKSRNSIKTRFFGISKGLRNVCAEELGFHGGKLSRKTNSIKYYEIIYKGFLSICHVPLRCRRLLFCKYNRIYLHRSSKVFCSHPFSLLVFFICLLLFFFFFITIYCSGFFHFVTSRRPFVWTR